MLYVLIILYYNTEQMEFDLHILSPIVSMPLDLLICAKW